MTEISPRRPFGLRFSRLVRVEVETDDRLGSVLPVIASLLQRRGRSLRALSVTAAVIIIVQAVTMDHFASRSYFFADDWLNFSLAQEHGLTRAYLVRGIFGHYMPLHRLLDYLVGAHSPPNYTVALCFLLLTSIGATFLVFRILVYLFGPNPWILLLVLILGFSTLSLSTMLWWAGAVHTLSAIFLGLLCTDGYLRYTFGATGSPWQSPSLPSARHSWLMRSLCSCRSTWRCSPRLSSRPTSGP